MTTRGPLRLAIAGCGRIVEQGYLPAVLAGTSFRVIGLADPDRDRLEHCRTLCATESRGSAPAAFADAASMLESEPVDALIVATPAEDHVAIATMAARAGVPALVEKPPAPDLAGARRLACLEPAPAIGFNRRFLQGARLAPHVPREGWLELDLAMSFNSRGWGAHVNRDEALLDAGVHLIDLAAFLTGSAPIAVRDASIAPERAAFELELGRGRVRIRCATDRRYAERVELRDRSGRSIAAFRTGRLRAAAGRLRRGEDPLVGSLRRQLERFAARADGGTGSGLAGPDDAIVAMSVVEAARRSAELGGSEVTMVATDGGQPVA